MWQHGVGARHDPGLPCCCQAAARMRSSKPLCLPPLPWARLRHRVAAADPAAVVDDKVAKVHAQRLPDLRLAPGSTQGRAASAMPRAQQRLTPFVTAGLRHLHPGSERARVRACTQCRAPPRCRSASGVRSPRGARAPPPRAGRTAACMRARIGVHGGGRAVRGARACAMLVVRGCSATRRASVYGRVRALGVAQSGAHRERPSSILDLKRSSRLLYLRPAAPRACMRRRACWCVWAVGGGPWVRAGSGARGAQHPQTCRPLHATLRPCGWVP